jgi:hypothetical protein
MPDFAKRKHVEKISPESVIYASILLIVIGLTACNGKADDNRELPTRVVIPTMTDVIETPSAVASDTPEIKTITATDTAEPEVTETPAPPTDEITSAAATDTPTLLAGPPLDVTNPPEPTLDFPIPPPETPFTGNGPPPAPTAPTEFVEDFSSLTPGEQVAISGEIIVPQDETDESGQPIAVIADGKGNEVRVLLPPPVVMQYEGQRVRLMGNVLEPEEEEGRLRIQPISPIDTGAEATEEAAGGPPVELQIIQLEPDLTALQAYDALIEELGDDLDDLDWISLVGNQASGWTITFYDPATDTNSAYTIYGDGTVQVAEMLPFALQPVVDNIPLDRARIVVDSDQVVEMIDDQGGPLVATEVLLTLQATSAETIEWTTDSPALGAIDATKAP